MTIDKSGEYIKGSQRFKDPLMLEALLPKGWKLLRRLRYRTNVGKQRVIQVPREFHTDLASIPRALRRLVTKDGPNRYAAVVHDYLYSLAGMGPKGVPRKQADMIFEEAMIDVGVPRWKRFLLHKGVRAGGWMAYNKHKRKNRI